MWPDPGGTAVALIGVNSVRVVGIDGTPRWSIALQNVQEVVWGANGELAIVAVNGVVLLDASTGAARASRCGWGFGLSAKPHGSPSRVESVCTQIAR